MTIFGCFCQLGSKYKANAYSFINDGTYFELGGFCSLQEELEVQKPEVPRLE